MRRLVIHFLLAAILLVGTSSTTPSIDFNAGRYNNVCKSLHNDVLVYFVFVDTRSTYPWSEFDILTTIDSIKLAVQWLEKEAKALGIPLRIKTDFYIGDEYTTIQKNLPQNSVNETINKMNLVEGMQSLSRWGDNISKTVGESLYIKEKDGIPAQKKPATKERLIAFLRDEYHVESVALLMLVNNYFKTDISLAINTLQNDDVEFAVVSYKYPSEIAHNFLHLYGAADLHETHFRRSSRNLKLAASAFPDDIMTDVYARSLNELEIGPYTQYMIGWSEELDKEYEPLMTERFTLFK
jgi:hypothetical protein